MTAARLPPTVTFGHVYARTPECVPPRQMRCAGCKGRIAFGEAYAEVRTDFGRHYWHPACHARKPRRHLSPAGLDRWWAARRRG